jgi:hypothetical protein
VVSGGIKLPWGDEIGSELFNLEELKLGRSSFRTHDDNGNRTCQQIGDRNGLMESPGSWRFDYDGEGNRMLRYDDGGWHRFLNRCDEVTRGSRHD